MTLSNLMQPAHQSAGRLLGYALTTGDSDTWLAASAVWGARLTRPERAAHAYAALLALDAEDVDDVLSAVLGGAGMPAAPFFDHLDEAMFWADLATLDELRAYARVAAERLPRRDQIALADFLHRRAAA